ncbi:hypothetical protein BHE74_00054346 [Ensete ventricosum]|nr:hypothetical protein BHE74_00054346 [Ensete ventricosum]
MTSRRHASDKRREMLATDEDVKGERRQISRFFLFILPLLQPLLPSPSVDTARCEYEGSLVILQPSISLREKKGRIWRLNNWGLRRLAYKIKKATHANYVLMNFELDAKFINDFKSLLDKDERIIRHLVMKRDEAITEDRPPPPEFHTLRAQQGAVDEDFDSEGEVEEEAWGDDEMELEMAGQDDFDNEADANIIIVDVDNENDRDDGTGRRAKILKYEGIKVVS